MPKCILHVGMHKTGTTSIQNSLKSLDDENFYYARIAGRANHSISMLAIFGSLKDGRVGKKHFGKHGMGLQENIRRAREGIETSIAAARGRTLVFSGEGMIKLRTDELAGLKSFMGQRGYDDIEIVAYVRPPYGYVSSAVQQKVKAGNDGMLRIKGSLPQYHAKFSKFDDVFGAENVRLIKFDPAAFEGNDVVLDFISKMGIARDSITLIRKNESITRLAAQLRFQHSELVESGLQRPIRGGLGSALCNRLRTLDEVKFRLAPSLLKPYIDSIKPDVQWMEQRLGQSLEEKLADEPGDILSVDDLRQPVPGIDEKLRALLAEAGVPVGGDGSETTGDLISLLARSMKMPPVAMTGTTDGSGPANTNDVYEQDEKRLARLARVAMGERAHAGGSRKRAGLPGEQPPGIDTGRALRRSQRLAARAARQGARSAVTDLLAPRDTNGRPGAERPKRLLAPSLRPRAEGTPVTVSPRPMINPGKNLVVLWSPKSACTTAYVWFSYVSGFLPQVRKYANWPHKHRQEVYDRSEFYRSAVDGDLSASRIVRIIRDPYSRAASIYRHALQTRFADKALAFYQDADLSFDTGVSFQQFLDFVATLDMTEVDIHFRPQFHPFEKARKPDDVINISKQDLFGALNGFERSAGWMETDFSQFEWLHGLEGKRKAKQTPLQGSSLDCVAYTRQDAKSGAFPSYDQLLTPEARAKIEEIYKVDFDAYREFL
jgi:hypothetical protein